MIVCSIDLETTGLDPETCDIVEIGAVVADFSKPLDPVEDLPTFHAYITPPKGGTYTGTPYALSMHSEIFRRIANREEGYTYLAPSRLGYVFRKFLVEAGFEEENDHVTITAAGKNFGSFDLQFLKRVPDFTKHVQIRHKILDPGSILCDPIEDDVIPSLDECLERMGFSHNVTHCAVDDARDVLLVLNRHYHGV